MHTSISATLCTAPAGGQAAAPQVSLLQVAACTELRFYDLFSGLCLPLSSTHLRYHCCPFCLQYDMHPQAIQAPVCVQARARQEEARRLKKAPGKRRGSAAGAALGSQAPAAPLAPIAAWQPLQRLQPGRRAPSRTLVLCPLAVVSISPSQLWQTPLTKKGGWIPGIF